MTTQFYTKGRGDERKVIPIRESLENPKVMESRKFQENGKKALETAARDGLKRLSEMDNVDAMLTDVKRFAGFLGEFSAYNALLIEMQDHDATRVMSKDNWKRLGFTIRDNASPIAVLVPYGVPTKHSQAKIAKAIEKMKKEGHSEEYITAKVLEMQGAEGTHAAHVFGVGRVYDAKSVNGKEPPEVSYKNSKLYEAMKRGAGSKFKIEEGALIDSRGETQMLENGDVNKIVVMKVPNESKEPLNTLAHEMSHAILKHNYNDIPRWKAEAEAELSAYLVLTHYGIDYKQESGAYIKRWLGKNRLGEEEIDRAANTARQIIKLTDYGMGGASQAG
ncbi:MAG: hypothetical protein JRN66_07825 [Nitrososphaerota archaeon]|nr:hypothetical protein [Nitrososphaerota archaeon]